MRLDKFHLFQSKKDGKDQDITWESDKKHNYTSQTRAKRSALSQQVTTRQQ